MSATHCLPCRVPGAGVGGPGVRSLPSPRPAPDRPPPTLPTSEAPRSRTVCCKPRNVSRSAWAGNVGGEEGKGGEPREESRGDTKQGQSGRAGPGSTTRQSEVTVTMMPSHFTDRETEVQSGGWICPQSWGETALEFEPRPPGCRTWGRNH